MLRWFFLFFFLLLQTACDIPADVNRPGSSLLAASSQSQPNDSTPLPAVEALTATDFLHEPTPVYRFETTAEALSVWRRATAEHPTLLLLSNNPHLQPVPAVLRKQAATLINNANPEILKETTTDLRPAPLLLPGMAVDAALRSDWFQAMVWALPLRDPAQELNLEKFIEQLSALGITDSPEISSLNMTGRTLHGVLRKTPFTAAALPQLQGLTQPVIVHIDLSYFQPLYKNEISTPLLDIVHTTLMTLKEMHLKTVAVTFSYSHLDNNISLDVRFLGDFIIALVEDPTRLDQPLPQNWQRQREALYLGNFFQKDKVRELYRTQEQEAPDAAWVKFNLYHSSSQQNEGQAALDYLAKAVALDPLYAREYLELSKRAYERERPDEALRMLSLASQIFQHDPFIKLEMAQLAQELGEKETSLQLLHQLSQLKWSEYYYPQVPHYLAELTTFVQTGEVQTRPVNAAAESKPEQRSQPPPVQMGPSRQRLLHNKEALRPKS